ncbi:MAG: Stk1 family PASTA domain-containing Ser/Thr kinase [Butyrivibrio sp.]|nr:Stk1 family PASTA domain-containing Ser/Thr kinase [Butyrivibrio sp.]
MIKIGMVIGDRYEVLEKIGTGGMSDVYKAKDHKLNRLVAVKVLKQEFSENENFVSKFRVEAQSTAGLMHPNIVNVYDVGDEDGINYIVMELVDGITLKKYIEKKVRLSVKEAVSIAIQVAMGLQAAHNNNIIHRDIKPQNIMISKDGKVKVTDFGIAKAATSNTITSNVMGSVHYTSPEQARGGYSDAKSDIYSLGITLFEMLTGRVPFNGDTTVAIAIKHIQEILPTPADYNDDVPISVEKIVLKCCQKSPDRRYQNAAELIQDLKKSLITPDVDFVTISDPDEDGATRIASEDDRERSNRQAAPSSDTDQMRLNRDVVREIEHDDYDEEEEYERRRRRPPRREYREDDEIDEEDERGDIPDELYYTGERDRRRQGGQTPGNLERVTVIIAIALAIIIGLVFVMIFAKGLGLFGSSEDTSSLFGSAASSATKESGIEIPDVTGKMYAEAKSILTSKGFTVEKAADKDNKAKADTVASTSPKAGERAEAGAKITVYISNGSNYKASNASASKSSSAEDGDTISVPDCVGLDTEEAIERLAEAGFENQVQEVKDPDPKKTDKVIKQSPKAGEKVKKGTKITLEVSIGPGVTTYSYSADIEAPKPGAEAGAENYTPGIPVDITVVATDGKVVYTASQVKDFPHHTLGTTGISVPTGTITLKYSTTTPIQTNPETGEQIGGGEPVTGTVTRSVNFTQG